MIAIENTGATDINLDSCHFCPVSANCICTVYRNIFMYFIVYGNTVHRVQIEK